MKILMVSSYLPYPLHDGGRIRLYNLLKFLKDKHEITLICEKRGNQTQKDIDEVAKVCKKVMVYNRPKAFSLQNIVRSTVSAQSFLKTIHSHKELTRLIKKELTVENFDLIHVETFYVMQNLPKTNLPIVLVEHNIEYKVYQRYANKAPILTRPFLRFDALKIKKEEMAAWRKVSALIAVSSKEQEEMGEDAYLVPNGVDTKRFSLKKTPKDKKQKTVLFIGDFRWVANRDSAIYIIKNIWPSIVSKYPEIKLWVVGKNIPDSIRNLVNPTIVFDENAPERTEEIFQASDVLLSPVRVGGGTNFKILESMSCGIPVVTNKLGNEGLRAKDKSEILICEKPDEFSNAVADLLKDEYMYEKMSRNGRDFVVKNFDWENVSLKLDEIYRSFQK